MKGTAERTRRRLARALRIVFAIAIVGLLLHWVGPTQVRARLATCPPSVALAALGTSLLAQWLGALRFVALSRAQGLPLTRAQALGINLSTVFYGLFLPGGTATSWIIRLVRLPGARQQLALALAVIASDRAFATAVGAVIGLTADLALGMPATFVVTAALVGVTLGSGFVGWALLSPTVAGWMHRWRERPLLRQIPQRLWRGQGTSELLPAATTVWAGALSVGVHGIGIFAWWILARGIGLELGLPELAWVRSAALVVGLLPLTVGGLGLREGTTVVLLGLLGIPAADALSLSLLAFLVTIFGVGAVGGIVESARLLHQRA
jgi:uncharacterized membrane protein YbhN (UPF0104 family)